MIRIKEKVELTREEMNLYAIDKNWAMTELKKRISNLVVEQIYPIILEASYEVSNPLVGQETFIDIVMMGGNEFDVKLKNKSE